MNTQCPTIRHGGNIQGNIIGVGVAIGIGIEWVLHYSGEWGKKIRRGKNDTNTNTNTEEKKENKNAKFARKHKNE